MPQHSVQTVFQRAKYGALRALRPHLAFPVATVVVGPAECLVPAFSVEAVVLGTVRALACSAGLAMPETALMSVILVLAAVVTKHPLLQVRESRR